MATCKNEFELFTEVKSWSPERCRECVHEIYPKLLKFITSENLIEQRSEALSILCASFLPSITIEASKIQVAEILLLAKELFELLFQSIANSPQDLEVTKTQFDAVICIISGLASCIQFFIESKHYNLKHSAMLLSILKQCYTHCSKSVDTYGEYFDCIKETLRKLLTHCHNLQSSLLAYLNVLQADLTSETVSPDLLVLVLDELFHVLTALAKVMDTKMTLPIWKTYFMILNNFHHVVSEQLDIGSVITYLCVQIKSTLQKDLDSMDVKEAFKEIKLCYFLFKLLVNLCDNFGGIYDLCIKDIVEVCIVLFKKSSPSVTCNLNPEISEEIKKTVMIGVEPLICHLLCSESFSAIVLSLPMEMDSFPICLLYLAIVKVLPRAGVTEKWLVNSSESIVSRMFECVKKCARECLIPVLFDGIMHSGKPQAKVSFYHYLCTHICAFVSSLTPNLFAIVEISLFSYLLCENPIVSLLASDILCFVARFSTSELCYSHCHLLAKLLPDVNFEAELQPIIYTTVTVLLKRLFSFLSDIHKHRFISKHSDKRILLVVESHNFLKSDVNIRFNDMDKFANFEQLNRKFDNLELKAKILKNICKNEQDFVKQWINAIARVNLSTPATEHILIRANRILASMPHCFKPDLCVLESIQHCIKSGSHCAYLLTLTCFESWFRNDCLTADEIHVLASCLSVGLNSSNFLFQQMAFRKFAEISSPMLNEQLVRLSLKFCNKNFSNNLKEYMKAYVSKELFTSDTLTTESLHIICKAFDDAEEAVSINYLNIDERIGNTAVGEPPIKKFKNLDELTDVMISLSESVSKLEEVCRTQNMDSNACNDLTGIVTRLNKLLI